MQSVVFYDESKFGDAFHAKVGASVPHTSPPPHSLHGSCNIESAAASLQWSVDPERTVLHLLFLGTRSGGEAREDWVRPFASRKWVVEFPSEVIACGVSMTVEETNHHQQTSVIRVVWLSAALSVEVLCFMVERVADGSDGIVVEPIGTAKSTGPLQQVIAAFGTEDLGGVQAAIAHSILDSDVLTALMLTDGHSVWSATVGEDGVAMERCVLHDGSSVNDGGDETTSQANASGFGGWSLFQRWKPQSGGAATGDANKKRHRRRSILGLGSIPYSEGFVLVNARGAVALLPTYDVARKTGGAVIPLEQKLFQYTDCIPTSQLIITAHGSLPADAVGSRSERTVDVVAVGRHGDGGSEHVWWHRCGIVQEDKSNLLLPVQASLMTVLAAPSQGAFVQSTCANEGGLHVLWRNVVLSCGLPVSIASLIASTTAADPAWREDDVCTRNTTVLHSVHASQMSSLADGTEACAYSVDRLDTFAAPCPCPHQVSMAATSDATAVLLLSYHRQRASASILFPCVSPSGMFLHSVVTECQYLGPAPSSIPFASIAFCPIFCGGDASSSCVTKQVDVPVFEGTRIVASHVEGPQTLINLLSDAANNISAITTLGGYHELAAAACIMRHTLTHHVQPEAVLDAAALALSDSMMLGAPMAPNQTRGRVVCFRSRMYVQQTVGLELLHRAAFLMASYVAWVAGDGHTNPRHGAIQRAVREALEILFGSVNAVLAAGPRFLAIAMRATDDLIEDTLFSLLNWSGKDATLHAVEVAWELWSLGGAEGWHSCAAWAQALRRRHTVLQHFTILQLLESSRTTSSSEITSISFNVASDLCSQPSGISVQLLHLFMESLSIPSPEMEADAFIASNPSSVVGLLYRAALLRRLLPRGSVHHSLLSANVAANAFLPDVIALKLTAVEQQGTASLLSRSLCALLADVYVLLSRSSLGDGCLTASLRWLSMALATSRDSVVDAAQRCCAMAADLIFSERWFNELVEIPLGDSDVMTLLTSALMSHLQRSIQGARTTYRVEAEQSASDNAVALIRFLVRRHAYGQAARLGLDVATLLRHRSESSAHTLVVTQQLLALALSSVECILDIEAPSSAGRQQQQAGGGGGGGAEGDASSAAAALHAGGFLSLRGSVSGKPYLTRQDSPLIQRKLMEATCEYRLLLNDHHVDMNDASYHEDVTSEAAAAYAQRLLRSLLAARLWDDARAYAEMTQPADRIVFVLQCQGMDLLEDKRHASSMSPLTTLDELTSSSFAEILDAWDRFIDECRVHATRETNFSSLSAVIGTLLGRHHELVPHKLKQALAAMRPSLLAQVMLDTRIPVAGSDVLEVPLDLAAEIFDIASENVSKGPTQLPAAHMLSAAILDRVVELARDVISRNPEGDAAYDLQARKLLSIIEERLR